MCAYKQTPSAVADVRFVYTVSRQLRRLGAGLLVGFLPWSWVHADPIGHVTDTTGVVEYNIADAVMFGSGAAPVYAGHAPYVGGACGAAGGAASLFACNFFDPVNNAATPWAWETAVTNTSAAAFTVPVGFFYPGGSLLGFLTLGAGSTFHVGIIVNDALIGEAGARNIWYSWRDTVAPAQNINVAAAVVEGAHAVPYIGPGDGIANTHGEYWYHFHSDPLDAFVPDQSIDPSTLAFAFMDPNEETAALDAITNNPIATPIPATVWLFGSGLAGLIGLARRKAA